ncbi:aldo/keto reductase [Microbacterium sp. 2MCAF23]|uniref:aldo/keto reductase n=1 Tax=Microbacterium sp. 2MCAF23 TaxID=3232985 RepID=UPI003F9BC0DC
MPVLGFGVFQTPPPETKEAVAAALATGYRLIDTAAAYANERGVGDAIRESGLARDEVFIETKIWISDYGFDQTLHAFDKSARKLGVDQIDLLLLHQALPGEFDKTLGAYRALEQLYNDGKVRAIGISNFMPNHLNALLTETEVVDQGRASRSPSPVGETEYEQSERGARVPHDPARQTDPGAGGDHRRRPPPRDRPASRGGRDARRDECGRLPTGSISSQVRTRSAQPHRN